MGFWLQALKLSNSAKRRSTVGEIVNLMAVDSQKFSELVGRIQILWAAPIQIAVALYFLWQELGPAVLGGLGVMITLIPLNSFLIRKLRALQVSPSLPSYTTHTCSSVHTECG